MNTTANTAFAPLDGTNSLYTELGVDLLVAEDESGGYADFIEWIDYTGQGEFTPLEADVILHEAGYRRSSEWEAVTGEYWSCDIEPLEA